VQEKLHIAELFDNVCKLNTWRLGKPAKQDSSVDWLHVLFHKRGSRKYSIIRIHERSECS
jgi:hypothetical protein